MGVFASDFVINQKVNLHWSMKSRLQFIKMKYSEEGKMLTNQLLTDQLVTFDLSIQVEERTNHVELKATKRNGCNLFTKPSSEHYK